jgi:type I restriction enzyme M protein
MRPAVHGGSRFGIVLNGSPLFTGGAGSGESEIRRYVLENDLVEAIIALPTDMFYNTGISTYVWIVSNRKPADRKGKVQLIDASGFWQKMRKSLGSKRKELSDRAHRRHHPPVRRLRRTVLEKEVTRGRRRRPAGGKVSRIFPQRGLRLPHHHRRAPLRDAAGKIVLGQKGKARASRCPTAACATPRTCRCEDVRNLLQARGAAPCAGCLDRPRQDQGRLRDPVQPALLRLQAAAPAGRDRRRLKKVTDRIKDHDRGADGMSFPRYPNYKDSGVEWLGRGRHPCIADWRHHVGRVRRFFNSTIFAIGI